MPTEQLLVYLGLMVGGWVLHRLGIGANLNVPFLPPPASSQPVVTVVPGGTTVSLSPVSSNAGKSHEQILAEAVAAVKNALSSEAAVKFEALLASAKQQVVGGA